jgi:hypothetical protein
MIFSSMPLLALSHDHVSQYRSEINDLILEVIVGFGESQTQQSNA